MPARGLCLVTWLLVTLCICRSAQSARPNYSRQRGRSPPGKAAWGVGERPGERYLLNIGRSTLRAYHGAATCPPACVCVQAGAHCDGAGLIHLPPLPASTRFLNAKDNHISRVYAYQLHQLTNLESLTLRNNSISWLESSALHALKRLRSLSLRDNRLPNLPTRAFKGLARLEVLSLRNNRLHSIEGMLKTPTMLRMLSLGGNQLTAITENTFATNHRLYIVNLQNNSIHTFHPNALKTQPHLRYLVLRDNPLTTLTLNLSNDTRLELLDLTNCLLHVVPPSLPASLRDLRLTENNIGKVDASDFQTTPNLRQLELSGNNLQDVDSNTFAELGDLLRLGLSNNSLTRLPANLPRNLTSLNIANNSIVDVEFTTLKYLSHLESLDLRHNKIVYIPQNTFKHSSALKKLDLGDNEIGALPPQLFKNTVNLQLLDLSHNPIHSVEHGCFYGLNNLHILQLSGVQSTSNMVPTLFENMHSLLYLDLSNSSELVANFAKKPRQLDYISSVEDLNLMHDRIHTLPPHFPQHFPNLKEIKLVDNPWICDARIAWLPGWINNERVSFFHKEAMRCHEPAELRGRSIHTLTYDELARSTTTRRTTARPTTTTSTTTTSTTTTSTTTTSTTTTSTTTTSTPLTTATTTLTATPVWTTSTTSRTQKTKSYTATLPRTKPKEVRDLLGKETTNQTYTLQLKSKVTTPRNIVYKYTTLPNTKIGTTPSKKTIKVTTIEPITQFTANSGAVNSPAPTGDYVVHSDTLEDANNTLENNTLLRYDEIFDNNIVSNEIDENITKKVKYIKNGKERIIEDNKINPLISTSHEMPSVYIEQNVSVERQEDVTPRPTGNVVHVPNIRLGNNEEGESNKGRGESLELQTMHHHTATRPYTVITPQVDRHYGHPQFENADDDDALSFSGAGSGDAYDVSAVTLRSVVYANNDNQLKLSSPTLRHGKISQTKDAHIDRSRSLGKVHDDEIYFEDDSSISTSPQPLVDVQTTMTNIAARSQAVIALHEPKSIKNKYSTWKNAVTYSKRKSNTWNTRHQRYHRHKVHGWS